MPLEPRAYELFGTSQLKVFFDEDVDLGPTPIRRWLAINAPFGLRTLDVLHEDPTEILIEFEDIGIEPKFLLLCGTATEPAGFDEQGEPIATGMFEIT